MPNEILKKYKEEIDTYDNYKVPENFWKNYSELKALNRKELEAIITQTLIHKRKYSDFLYNFLKFQVNKDIPDELDRSVFSYIKLSKGNLQLLDSRMFYPAKNLLSDLVERDSKKSAFKYFLIGIALSSLLTLVFGYFINLSTPWFKNTFTNILDEPIKIEVMDLPIIKNNIELKQEIELRITEIDSLNKLNHRLRSKLDSINKLKK